MLTARARLAGLSASLSRPIEPSGDFGLIGLAVMGQNLILNAADHGFTVIAFNRTVSKVDRFLENEAKGEQRRRQQAKDNELRRAQENQSSVLTPSKNSAPSSRSRDE